MCFHLTSFSNFSDAENAQDLSGDASVFIDTVYVYVFIWIHFRERFHIAVVSPKTLGVLVWTEGPSASECMRFQTKTHYCGQGLRQYFLSAGLVLSGFAMYYTKNLQCSNRKKTI